MKIHERWINRSILNDNLETFDKFSGATENWADMDRKKKKKAELKITVSANMAYMANCSSKFPDKEGVVRRAE